ncbi:DUF6216 family protein [Acidovorax sp. GBBC 3334]|uniref:DUF6216 family protein n=1 Tax=unclassified Acidovorax TaxID=2684926 RepID=UPI00230218A4|nr:MULTISPECIES: DUF6216 family protein [unclassified Acidovorax]MDA8456526.1 DUF6216 family protein [Acidovorax sp. GBBC 3334]MDA8523544.1 DUF6216 family protein [Acidovorax sp. NCPPB 4044]
MDGIAAIKVSDIVALGSLGAAIGLGGLFFWMVWQTESWHMLRRRVWLLVHGKEEISDPAIRGYVEEQNNLAAFHVFAGVRVASLDEAQALMAWCRARNVDLGVLRMCGTYFDPEARRIRERWLPQRWMGHALGVAAMVLMVAGLLLVVSMTMPPLMSLKTSGQGFFAEEGRLRKAWPYRMFSVSVLTAGDCEKPPAEEARRTGFAQSDITILCSLLKEPEFGAYRDKAANSQRSALAICAAFILFFAYRTAVWAVRIAWARKLLRRGVDPALPATQREFDFGRP